jgi:hypothetical protein
MCVRLFRLTRSREIARLASLTHGGPRIVADASTADKARSAASASLRPVWLLFRRRVMRLRFVVRIAGEMRQIAVALEAFRILFSPLARPRSQVVGRPAVAFSRRRRGPTFWRHYSLVLPLATCRTSVFSRASRACQQTKGGFLLSPTVRDAEQRMRAKTQRSPRRA